MSNCMRNCNKLCERFILSESVTFTGGNLVVNLPIASYDNDNKYCIVLAQVIPDATTINAPVVFTIGTGTTQYPFVNKDCTPILASQVRTRTKYPVFVNPSVNSGVFKYVGECCLPSKSLSPAQSLPSEPTTPPATN